jgi:hypothetical protein
VEREVSPPKALNQQEEDSGDFFLTEANTKSKNVEYDSIENS